MGRCRRGRARGPSASGRAGACCGWPPSAGGRHGPAWTASTSSTPPPSGTPVRSWPRCTTSAFSTCPGRFPPLCAWRSGSSCRARWSARAGSSPAPNSAREDIRGRYGVDAAKVAVIPLGAASPFRPRPLGGDGERPRALRAPARVPVLAGAAQPPEEPRAAAGRVRALPRRPGVRGPPRHRGQARLRGAGRAAAGATLRGRRGRGLRRPRSRRRPPLLLRGRQGLRLPVALRGLRPARHRGHGVRRARHLLGSRRPARAGRRRRAAGRPGGHRRPRRRHGAARGRPALWPPSWASGGEREAAVTPGERRRAGPWASTGRRRRAEPMLRARSEEPAARFQRLSPLRGEGEGGGRG